MDVKTITTLNGELNIPWHPDVVFVLLKDDLLTVRDLSFQADHHALIKDLFMLACQAEAKSQRAATAIGAFARQLMAASRQTSEKKSEKRKKILDNDYHLH